MYYYLHYCCLARFLYTFSQCLQTSRALIYIRFVPILLRLGKWSSSKKFGLELGFQCNCSPLRPGLRHWSSSRFGRGLLLQVELKPWEQNLTSNSNFQHTKFGAPFMAATLHDYNSKHAEIDIGGHRNGRQAHARHTGTMF